MDTAPPRMRCFYRFMRFLSRMLFKIYFRGRAFHVERVPDAGGVLIVSNHQSYFDPVAVGQALPREISFMARDTLFRNPIFGRLIRALNAFPVRRGAADVGAVKEALRQLRNGWAVVIFPEATRSPDGRLGPINPNSLAIAKRAEVPIVPTIVDGAFEAWPRSQRWPSPRPVHVTYAEPIQVEQVREWTLEQITETITKRMQAALEASKDRRHGESSSKPPA
ncbi:MAG: 1-acyl-sn-glycerol-3-phosphate acyltransferase [Phycisphaerae bacterium]|nr:MAG: 1-acyl-sn-glycerol-3-phosphate acyltransferase [Planctomycetota bacterium]GJQ26831.1 MAG: 1-acyl-sn-glycerol-3-phosphate acyltransferase [Phycisphaerae bacterium]